MNTREIGCEDLGLAIDDLRREGFRLDAIYPADDPKCAVMSRAGESIRVAVADAPPPPDGLPPFVPDYLLTRGGAGSSAGRAGMLYRDLIPGRLGGRYIASHITIPDGGPVGDWVHYHRIALQIIIVVSGWVRVVYEGQGPSFVMEAGDMVLQPPLIRHRVLESSPGLEVVEISAPALHETFADHDVDLPSEAPFVRSFGHQRFLWHRASKSKWTPFGAAQALETEMGEATGGLADVRLLRSGCADRMEFAPHPGELVFGFVIQGTARLGNDELSPACAFVIPPAMGWVLSRMSPEFELLHLTTARLDASAHWLL